MIPKRIHYCWLGGGRMPEIMHRCMDSWKRVLAGYEFVLWDTEKARGIGSRWVDDAIAKKQWAFAADYVRLYALYSQGGIYLDTDVEVLRDFSPLLSRPLLLGEEGGSGLVEAAVMGAEPGNATIGKALRGFDGESYGETMPHRLSRTIGGDVELLPSETFSPMDWKTGKLRITDGTYAIHRFAGSWLSAKERWALKAGRVLGGWAVPCTRWIFSRFGK